MGKRIMYSVFVAAIAFFVVAAYCPPVRAEDPCKVDIQKFCKDMKPGGGRLVRCLKEHKAELSPDCRAALRR